MAPPAREKRRGVPETLDPKSRVQKSVNNTERAQLLAAALTRSIAKANAVAEKLATVQGEQVVTPQSENPSPPKMNIDTASELDLESEIESESEIDEFPPLPSDPSLKRTLEALSPTQGSDYTKDNLKVNHRSQNSTLMTKARGLLNLVGPYLEEMETDCPGAGAGFLALISEGVFRAIRGETIYLKTSTNTEIMPNSSANKKNSWASRVANVQTSIVNNLTRKPRTKPTPPEGQSHEDRRVMIRLEHNHEARKTEPFLLRQQLQRILPDPSPVADTMQVPSGIAILAPTPAKAAAILQYRDVIAQRFGKAIVERQESWTTFIIGPLPKKVTTMDGKEDTLDGLLLQELGLCHRLKPCVT
ncbi:hypothetical protein EV44_g3608 [Erysiphe necator]|uniref:Uncharacterized protein n=1 Tax=Uncinula necator TaxID=52586 RepID=A0A0B1P211_UNCNE|nr:hypothetical protein EV44_g3608 [Erysiphe necator]